MKEKIKKFFSTPKRTVITIAVIVAVIAVVGAGCVFAAGTSVKSTAIGEENAIYFACANAGIDPTAAEDIECSFEYEQGQFVYDIEFEYDSTEYEYWIKASDGSVVKKHVSSFAESDLSDTSDPETETETDTETTDVAAEAETETTAVSSSGSSSSSSSGSSSDSSSAITLSEAKSAALSDAGLSSSDVTFTKAKSYNKNGTTIYTIEFYTSSYEYEYEINGSTGAVISKEAEAYEVSDTSGSSGYIGTDSAKEIAASHAGYSVSEVTFSKVKLEEEDGIYVYEIEFKKDETEYEYTIKASDGIILEYDIDN